MNDLRRDRHTVRRLSGLTDAEMHGLALVLVDCVEDGASVSFMHPLSLPKALAFWRRVADDVESGARALLVAEDATGIVGTVQVVLEQPENQPHRADISKMLVHRRARRRGIGAALLTQLVKATPQQSTISIRAPTNNPAVRLYERFGFKVVEQSEGAVRMRREA